jgi:hypothetical protein
VHENNGVASLELTKSSVAVCEILVLGTGRPSHNVDLQSSLPPKQQPNESHGAATATNASPIVFTQRTKMRQFDAHEAGRKCWLQACAVWFAAAQAARRFGRFAAVTLTPVAHYCI